MQQDIITETFFELIRLGIGTGKELSHTPSAEEWKQIFELSQKQALLGIAFSGVEKLNAEQLPPKALILVWHNLCLQIKQQNTKLNRLAAAINKKFESEGFRNVILKGQGIARLYDQPLRRVSGDIDIWLEGGRKKILTYVKRYVPNCRPVYHHVDFMDLEGVSIEVHFTPTWMNCYFTNKKLQSYFEREAERQMCNRLASEEEKDTIYATTNDFNRIYILLHIYRHLFQEGIGLRQLLDYYYVLKQDFSEEEKQETIKLLRDFKMMRFAGAVMYVLKRVFNIEDKYLLTKPLEKEGDFLLNEIMVAGNFGKYSPRYKNDMSDSLITRAISKSSYHLRFFSSYPSETFWGPLFRIWHFFYKKKLKSMV